MNPDAGTEQWDRVRIQAARVMNGLRWVTSAVVVPTPAGTTVDEIRQRVTNALKRKGATNIDTRAGRVHFRADRAIFSTNPLSLCHTGSFQVEPAPGGMRIQYELDFCYLLILSAIFPVMAIPFGLGALFARGSFFSTVFLFCVLSGILSPPLGHIFAASVVKDLFRTAGSAEA